MATIHILAVNDPAVSYYSKDSYKAIKDIEEKLSIDIKMDIVDFDAYYGTLMQGFCESYYDIVMVAGHLWLSSFVEKGYLSCFHLKEDHVYDYHDVLETIRDEMIYKTKQYLLPSFCDGHMLLYRSPHVKLEGHGPVSIKELTDGIESCKSRHPKPFVLKAHESEIFLDFLPYLRGFGVEPFSEVGEPQFNCSKGIRALKRYIYLMEFADEESANYGNDEVREEIQQDRCDLAITWGGQLGAVMGEQCHNPKAWKFRYMEIPWNVTWSFGINSKSLNQELALEVMKAMTTKKIDVEVGRICGNPTRESSFIVDKDNYVWYEGVKEMINHSKHLSSFKELPDAIGAVTGELRHALLGTKTPEEAMKNAEELVLKLLSKQ